MQRSNMDHNQLQILDFVEQLTEGVQEAIPLMNEDPERAKRTLRAIVRDLWTIDELLLRLISQAEEPYQD